MTNTASGTSGSLRGFRAELVALLALSLGLRIWLAASGGQGWWPDESRFATSQGAVEKLAIGHVPGALKLLFGTADHLGFRLVALPAAAAIWAGGPVWLAAAYLGAFSVGSIYLVWRIALLTSGDDATAWWSAFFAAASVSLFYYTRQLFPYDPALCFGLAGLAAGLKGRPLLAGLWSSAGFLTYNGYWLFCGLTLLLAIGWGAAHSREFCRRAVWAVVGLFLPIGAVLALGRAVGADLVQSYVNFSHTITLGDFNEGWTFPWEYFWKTEGLFFLIWMICWAAGLAGLVRAHRSYLWVWSISLLAIYLGLGFAAVVLHKFVLYGRIARCLTPLFALICGGCAAALIRTARAKAVAQAVVVGLVAALSFPHFLEALTQWYPEDFAAKAKQLMAAHHGDPRLRLVNDWFYRDPTWVAPLPLGETIFARRHPMQYEPFLYENQRASDRARYRARDMTMRLGYPLESAVRPRLTEYAGYTGPVRLLVRLKIPANGDLEPLVTTGTPGNSDGLYVCSHQPGHYQFGVDHWNGATATSLELTLDAAATHAVDVSFGSLLPFADEYYRGHRAVEPLRHRLWVAVDGKVVFDQAAQFHPAEAEQVDFGFNLAEMRAIPVFAGDLEEVRALPLSSVPPH